MNLLILDKFLFRVLQQEVQSLYSANTHRENVSRSG